MNYRLITRNRIRLSLSFVLSIASGLMVLLCCTYSTVGQNSESFWIDEKQIDAEEFDKKISQILDEMGIPGMSLAIIDDDHVVYSNGYGMRRKGEAKDSYAIWNVNYGYSVKGLDLNVPVDNETVFNGASLSKTFLAFVAFQLADERMLNLDKPMYEYMEYDRLEHDDRYRQITARMVLSHSSGLENWGGQHDSNKLDIVYDPGAEYLYSGEGYNFLNLVINKILQEDYEEFVTKRVIDKLGLKNSYLKFNEIEDAFTLETSIPSNFAAAHPLIGGQYLMRNVYVNPAFANHFNAEGYAKLILAMFSEAQLTKDRRADILEARVRKGNADVFYGPGFELAFDRGDTIISHGGDNPGIKNLMFYSPVKKRGFVMMVNSDIGNSMAAKINELSVNLNIDKFLNPRHALLYSLQYPDPALGLLKTFQNKDTTAMFSEFEELKKEKKIEARSLNSVAAFFLWYGNGKVGFKLLKNALSMFPDSSLTHSLLGEYYMNEGKYKLALDHFNKSKELNFVLWNIKESILECEEELSSPE